MTNETGAVDDPQAGAGGTIQPLGQVSVQGAEGTRSSATTPPEEGATPDGGDETARPTGEEPAAGDTGASPFAGIGVSDYVRDGVAAVLLLVSLALPWDLAHRASDRIEVVLLTVVSLLSLALPYLARTGALPATWTVHTTRRARLFANAPYAVLVLVYLVLDVINGGSLNSWGGLGTGAALGLAGAVLAAQPRENELGPLEADRAVSETWLRALVGVGGLVVLTALTAFVLGLTDGGGVGMVVYLIASLAFVVALAGLPILGTFRRSEGARIVLVALGVVLVVTYVLGSGDSALPRVESLHWGTFGILFLPAAAAVAASAPVQRLMEPEDPVRSWVRAAVLAFDLLVVVSGYVALVAVVGLIEGLRGTSVILTLVVGIITAGIAFVARQAISRDAVAGRILALGAAAAVAVLGLVLLVVLSNQEGPAVLSGARVEHVLLAFGLPLVAAFALTVPRPVREHFAVHTPQAGGPGSAATSAYVWQPPAPKAPKAPKEPRATAPAASSSGGYDPQAGYGTPHAGRPGAVDPGQGAAPERTGYAARPGLTPEEESATQVMPAYTEHQPAPAQYQPQVQTEPQAGHQPQYQAPQQPAYQQPAQEPSAAPAEQGAFTAQQALDPATPLEVLAQIVQDAPHLRAQVAANPSTYPALLDWLGNLGDPAVDAALRSRGQHG